MVANVCLLKGGRLCIGTRIVLVVYLQSRVMFDGALRMLVPDHVRTVMRAFPILVMVPLSAWNSRRLRMLTLSPMKNVRVALVLAGCFSSFFSV